MNKSPEPHLPRHQSAEERQSALLQRIKDHPGVEVAESPLVCCEDSLDEPQSRARFERGEVEHQTGVRSPASQEAVLRGAVLRFRLNSRVVSDADDQPAVGGQGGGQPGQLPPLAPQLLQPVQQDQDRLLRAGQAQSLSEQDR